MQTERYWGDAAMVALGATLAVGGAVGVSSGATLGLGVVFIGVFLGSCGLFTGIQVAVRGGQT